MPRPSRIEDHPAPIIRIRATVPRKPDREFHLKAVPASENESLVNHYMGQKHWLE